MKKIKTKTIIAIVTTAILISLMASSIIVNADVIINRNSEQLTTSPAPAYMSESNSAYSNAATYGDLLNEEYGWGDPHGNVPERTGFNPGPAPDRPDVLFRTNNVTVPRVILGTQVVASGVSGGVNSPYVATFSGAPMAMAGQLILSGTIRVNATNSTTRNAVISLNPHTGTVNWVSLLGLGPTAGTSVGSSLAGSSYIFKVDDTHFCVVGLMAGGLAMFRTDGTFLWQDNSIQAGAYYHSLIVAPDPVYMVFLSRSPGAPGLLTNYLCGFTLDDPEKDRNEYGSTGAFLRSGRSVWNYTVDESGNTPIQCYGDGRVYMASYSSTKVYAINATNGEKIWETDMPSFNGYMTCYGDGKLFVGCLSFHVHALNATDGAIIWHNNDGEANRAFNVWCMNYAYGRLYTHDLGFGRTGAQKCFDAETGKLLWASTELHSIGYYTTCVADGKIYGNQADGSTTTGRTPDPVNFCCWDAYTGEVLWSIRATISLPVVAYGCLYFILNSQVYALSTAVQASQDWAMWRGSVENPGFTLSPGPVDISGGPKWTFTTGSGIISSPVVSKGKLYINSNDGYTYCLNAYNGTMIWRHASNEPLMTSMGSTPAIAGDKVIVGPDDGNLYILDADTGAEKAKVSMGPYRSVQIGLGQHTIRSSPIVYNSKIYVASIHDNKFYCLSMDGRVDWSIETGYAAGSVGISNDTLYLLTDTNRLYKMTPSGSIIWNVSCTGGNLNNFTPVVVGDYVYLGVTSGNMRAFNATNGNQIFQTRQTYSTSENSHGSVTYVPRWALSARNSSGYTFGGSSNTATNNVTDFVIGQAGPTLSCMRADNGSNIWANWGGWEIWGSPVVAGIGNSAAVYIGSDSGSIQVVNASNGVPLSWFTTGSEMSSSPAIWDGKLYVGSTDNKVYCFEDHANQNMAISMSLDKTTVDLNNTETVTVTAQLTKVPTVNVYEEIGRAAPVPPLPNATVLVTVTDSDGVDKNYTATTDNNGMVTVTFTPNKPGTWKAIAWYTGEDRPTFSYGYAFSDQVPIEAAYTITEEPVQPPTTGTNIPVEYVYAAVIVVVIVVVAAAALMLLRRRKK